MRVVGVVTVARSDYGIYRPVLRALEERGDARVQLYVGGTHLVERFGLTVSEIERDGYPIVERVHLDQTGDSPLEVAAAIGSGVGSFAAAFERSRPDIVVLLGDRFEMFAAGIAALPLALPVAHIHGGESTEGAIDEAFRHSLTKLSHVHFAATEKAGRRIVQLGEEPWRVHVTGSPALDAVRGFTPLSDAELQVLGIRLRGPTLLVTYHPVTLQHERAGEQFGALVDAVDASGLDAVFTHPNADTSYGAVVCQLELLPDANDRFTVVRNLGTDAYFTLMTCSAAMVGNSSSGIIEAAAFRLPVVDVGVRQRGRERAANVIHADPEAPSIRAAIARATSPDFRRGLDRLSNPYGDGRAGERIAEVLATVPLDERLLLKRFFDTDAVSQDRIRVVGLGAGGHAAVVIEALGAAGCYEVVGLTDPRRELWGSTLLGVPVLGDDDELSRQYDQGVSHAFIGLGGASDTSPRRRLYELAKARGFAVVSAVHPAAVVSPSARIGAGATLLATAVVGAEVSLGENVIVNSGAIVEHACRLGDHVHVATGARLASGVVVHDGAHIGAGATVLQGLSIGSGSIVGAGAVVTRDVAASLVAVGVPARTRRRTGA